MPVHAAQAVQLHDEDIRQSLLQKLEQDCHVLEEQQLDQAELDELDRSAEKERLRSVEEFWSWSVQTRDLPLAKLICSPEGVALFNELCMRMDVNQKYASILPQWKDLADLLDVDRLHTVWIETCVRPKEGLTRAMLEIYMKDGGSLGDLIDALIKLEMYDILGAIRNKMLLFLDQSAHSGWQAGTVVDKNFFSVLGTLASIFPAASDPCRIIYQMSQGLNHYCSQQPISDKLEVRLVQSGCEGASVSLTDYPLSPKKQLQPEQSHDRTCKILLLFSSDGVSAAQEAVQWSSDLSYEGWRVDLFRLNEITLWYEMLSNPEACCMKWINQADYIIPVLTPNLLREMHADRVEEQPLDDVGPLIPTSPVLNRYMYTLMRAQFTQAGCKNYKVRPVIPQNHLLSVRTCNAVTLDPLLNHTWIVLARDKFVARIMGLLRERIRRC